MRVTFWNFVGTFTSKLSVQPWQRIIIKNINWFTGESTFYLCFSLAYNVSFKRR